MAYPLTATARSQWHSYSRTTNAHLSVNRTANADGSATYSVTGSASSGENGQRYAAQYAAKVELFYRVGSGSWVSLGSTTGTLNYGDTVGSITKTATINKATSSQSVSFACDVTSPSGYWSTASAQVSDTVTALTSYAVAFNANGGSGAPGSQTKWYGKALTLSSTKPTRTGHSFSKWNTASGGTGTNYSPGASYTANSAATLYAQWVADTYTVKYDANGGSGAPSSQTKTYGQALTLSSAKPTRTNYTFKGWATTSSATTATYQPGGSYTANAAATLYAVWELAYRVPTISSASVRRCDASGSAADEGTSALLALSWSVDATVDTANVGKTAKVSWKATTASSYGTAKSYDLSGKSGTLSKVLDGTFDTTKSYDVLVEVADTHGGSTSRRLTLTQAFFTLDLLAGGHGVAIGKPATTEGLLDVGLIGRFAQWVEVLRSDVTNNVAPSANSNRDVFAVKDSLGEMVAYIRSWWYTNGRQGIELGARRPIDGTTHFNTIGVYVEADGTRVVSVTESLPWRKAIAANSTGVWQRAIGGTGVTGVQSSTVSLTSGATSSVNTNVCRHNGVVATMMMIDVKLAAALASGGNVVIGTVPSGFRPVGANAYAQCITQTGYPNVWARITTGGEVRISNRSGASFPTSATATFTLTYCI